MPNNDANLSDLLNKNSILGNEDRTIDDINISGKNCFILFYT